MTDPDSHGSHRFIDFVDEPSLKLPPIQGLRGLPVPSIEAATTPLLTVLKDVDKMLEKVYGDTRLEFMNKHERDEAVAILLYTLEWNPEESLYHGLNRALASKERDQRLQPWLLFLRLFLVGLSKRPLVEKTAVYRGVSLLVDYPGRKELTWWPFTSTSREKTVAMNFVSRRDNSTLFVMNIRSGREIRDLSEYPDEKEVLLPPMTHFTIERRERDGDGLTIVYMDEIDARKDCPMPIVLSYDKQNLTDADLERAVGEAIAQQCTDLHLTNNEITSTGVCQLIRCLNNNPVGERHIVQLVFSNR